MHSLKKKEIVSGLCTLAPRRVPFRVLPFAVPSSISILSQCDLILPTLSRLRHTFPALFSFSLYIFNFVCVCVYYFCTLCRHWNCFNSSYYLKKRCSFKTKKNFEPHNNILCVKLPCLFVSLLLPFRTPLDRRHEDGKKGTSCWMSGLKWGDGNSRSKREAPGGWRGERAGQLAVDRPTKWN